MAIAETFRSESFAVASLAVNVLVGSITSQNRVKWPVAIAAIEAFFVPFLSFGKHQLSRKDRTATTGATLALWSLDRLGVDSLES